MLHGHERAITQIMYNSAGDLLFSVAKDNKPTVWYSANGERLGTYNGHGGAVWCIDVNRILELCRLGGSWGRGIGLLDHTNELRHTSGLIQAWLLEYWPSTYYLARCFCPMYVTTVEPLLKDTLK